MILFTMLLIMAFCYGRICYLAYTADEEVLDKTEWLNENRLDRR